MAENRRTDWPVRETYTEYRDGGVLVAAIRDPDNEYAWIQSSVTMGVED